MLTLWRMINYGVQNFWRNIWLSVITVLILVLNLFLISLVFGLNILGQQTLTAVKSKVDVAVYFTSTTTEERATEVMQELQQKPEVKNTKLITRAERLAQFEKTSNDPKTINAALETLGENPLGPGIVVTARNLDDYPKIIQYFKDPKYSSIVEDTGNQFQNKQEVIHRLSGIVSNVHRAAFGLTILFAVIAILMVFNTIRITIYAHREEIGIMKLVGASDAFVRGPFIVTSIMYGFVASALTALLLVPILGRLNPFLTHFFAGYDINLLSYVRSNWLSILGIELAMGCVLSALSSLFAVGRYLRV